MKNVIRKLATVLAAGGFIFFGTGAFARDVTNLMVASDGTVTATFEAGDEGDGHVL